MTNPGGIYAPGSRSRLKIVASSTPQSTPPKSPRGKKIYWYRKISLLQGARTTATLILLITGVSALFATMKEGWHGATTLWMVSFFLMFLLWAVEFHQREALEKQMDLYNTKG